MSVFKKTETDEATWAYDVGPDSGRYQYRVHVYRNDEEVGMKRIEFPFLARFYARRVRKDWKRANIKKEF